MRHATIPTTPSRNSSRRSSCRSTAGRRSPAARWLAAGLFGAGLLGGIAGCEYTATVRNESRKTVVAELEHDRFLSETVTKRSAMLEPGDQAVLGPFKVDPLEPITLRVRIVDDVFGGTQSERLEPGDQTFVIENGNLQSWEAVRIRRESD